MAWAPLRAQQEPSKESRGPVQWSDLDKEQKLLIASWFLLADAERPSKHEELPLECASLIAGLAQVAGKYRRIPFEKMPRTGAAPGFHSMRNGKRIVRVRKATGRLAT